MQKGDTNYAGCNFVILGCKHNFLWKNKQYFPILHFKNTVFRVAVTQDVEQDIHQGGCWLSPMQPSEYEYVWMLNRKDLSVGKWM